MSKGSGSRSISKEEAELLAKQGEGLDRALDIAQEQWDASKEDKAYINKIYRGHLDHNDPRVKKRVAEILGEGKFSGLKKKFKDALNKPSKPSRSDFPLYAGGEGAYKNAVKKYESKLEKYNIAKSNYAAEKERITNEVASELGGKGVDEMLMDAVSSSNEESKALLETWKKDVNNNSDLYKDTLSGLSDEFRTKISNTSDAMGTVNDEVYAGIKGANLAGISQAYAESQKQLEGVLSQRGLAGTGVEAGALGTLMNNEARTKANALSASYTQAIGASDAQRMGQLNLAESSYNAGNSLAATNYGIGQQIADQTLQYENANIQQNISTLSNTVAISNGGYNAANNLLAASANTSNQSANISGNAASGIAQADATYRQAQSQENAALTGAIGTAAGMGAAAFIKKL